MISALDVLSTWLTDIVRRIEKIEGDMEPYLCIENESETHLEWAGRYTILKRLEALEAAPPNHVNKPGISVPTMCSPDILAIRKRLLALEAAPPNHVHKPDRDTAALASQELESTAAALNKYIYKLCDDSAADALRIVKLEGAMNARNNFINSKQFNNETAKLHRRIDSEAERMTKAVSEFSKAWKNRDESKYLELSARQDELANEYSALEGKYTEAYARMAQTMRDFKTEIFDAMKSHHMRLMDLEEGPVDKPGNGFLKPAPNDEQRPT